MAPPSLSPPPPPKKGLFGLDLGGLKKKGLAAVLAAVAAVGSWAYSLESELKTIRRILEANIGPAPPEAVEVVPAPAPPSRPTATPSGTARRVPRQPATIPSQ